MTARPPDRIVDWVGKTPLVHLKALGRAYPSVAVLAKLEFRNPGGSVKDRAASRIILGAMARGELASGRRLIDSTSGNTGVAYSLYGAALGVPVTLVMPPNVSRPRKDIARAFGTELIFSDPLEGSDGAIRRVRELVAAEPDRYYYPDQYSNEDNPLAHYHGTGPEILEALGTELTHFVAGIGTSGTIMGTSRRLREANPSIRTIAVEPEDSFHGLEGLKHLPSSLVPAIHSADGYDRTVRISTELGWETTERLGAEEHLFVGHSSGANVAAALLVARELHESGQGGTVVTVLCDRADRYFECKPWRS